MKTLKTETKQKNPSTRKPESYNFVRIGAMTKFNKQETKTKQEYMNDLTCRYILIGLSTGLRFSDILNLKLSDFKKEINSKGESLYTHSLKQKKTGGVVFIRIDANDFGLVENNMAYWQIEDKPFLWNAKTKNPKNLSLTALELNLKKMFAVWSKEPITKREDESTEDLKARIGAVPFSSHSIRKTSAYQLYKKTGGNLPIVKNMLGHKNISTTFKYLNIDSLTTEEYLKENISLH